MGIMKSFSSSKEVRALGLRRLMMFIGSHLKIEQKINGDLRSKLLIYILFGSSWTV